MKVPSRAGIAGALLATGLFVAAVYVLHRELHEFTVHDVVHEFRSLRVWRLALALLLSALGYGALVGYDLLALRWIGRALPLRRVVYAAFVGSAFANNIPMAFFVGGSVRYRLYSREGLTAPETAALVVVNITTYALGLLTVAAVVFTATTPLFAAAAGAIVVGYLAWSALRSRPLRIRGFDLPAPEPALTLAQIGVSLLDWTFSGGALYALLPTAHHLSFPGFFGVFILGQLAALVAQLPGGLGVFEAVMVATLAPTLAAPAVLGALLAYRVIYFFLPFGIASALFAIRELASVRRL
jgi:phosphatidylglycerol lysyltransferase